MIVMLRLHKALSVLMSTKCMGIHECRQCSINVRSKLRMKVQFGRSPVLPAFQLCKLSENLPV
jgi:hypothetical protein